MKKLKKKTPFPDYCPKCKSVSIEFGDIESDGDGGIYQVIECYECDTEFIESFTSTGWEEST